MCTAQENKLSPVKAQPFTVLAYELRLKTALGNYN